MVHHLGSLLRYVADRSEAMIAIGLVLTVFVTVPVLLFMHKVNKI